MYIRKRPCEHGDRNEDNTSARQGMLRFPSQTPEAREVPRTQSSEPQEELTPVSILF